MKTSVYHRCPRTYYDAFSAPLRAAGHSRMAEPPSAARCSTRGRHLTPTSPSHMRWLPPPSHGHRHPVVAAAPSTYLPHVTRTTLSPSRPARTTGTTGDEKQRLAVLTSTPDVLLPSYLALERPHRRRRWTPLGTGIPAASTQDG